MKKSGTPLSKEIITNAAIKFADQKGIDSLSMRSVAGILSVKAMSLYNHIQNKNHLIDEMVDSVIGEFYIPAPDKDWKESMKQRAVSMYQSFINHPWAAMTILPRIKTGPNYLTFLNATLLSLSSAGFSLPSADWAINAMDSYIFGFAIQQLTFPIDESGYQKTAAEYLPLIDKKKYPLFFELSKMVSSGEYSGDQDFLFGLEIILDGLENKRD